MEDLPEGLTSKVFDSFGFINVTKAKLTRLKEGVSELLETISIECSSLFGLGFTY